MTQLSEQSAGVKPAPTAARRQADCPVRLEFGRKLLPAGRISGLKAGSVIELESFVDDYVDVYAGEQLVARGRAVVVDGKLAVRVQEPQIGPLPI